MQWTDHSFVVATGLLIRVQFNVPRPDASRGIDLFHFSISPEVARSLAPFD